MTEQTRATTHTAEEGSATVTVVCLVAVAVMLLGLVLAWITGSVQLLQAQRSADLAALAAADAHRGLTSHEPCQIATNLVTENGGTLQQCDLGAEVATVRAQVGLFSATSRAGAVHLHPAHRP